MSLIRQTAKMPEDAAGIALPASESMLAQAPYQQQMGCNREGEDLDPPLPKSWTLAQLKGGELPVTVFLTQLLTPGGTRLRTLLKFYEVPFDCVNVPYGKVDPSYVYKKQPVVRIGTKDAVATAYQTNNPELGRLINDTYIQIKSLGEILQGRKFTDQELEILKQTTFGLQYAFIVSGVKQGKMSGPLIDVLYPHEGFCKKCCYKCCLGCCCPYCCCPLCCNEVRCGGGKVDKIFKEEADKFGVQHTKPGSKRSFADTARWYGDRLQGSFFAGDAHGVVDVDLFSIVHHSAKTVGDLAAAAMLDGDARLKAWYERMVGLAGHVDQLANLRYVDPCAAPRGARSRCSVWDGTPPNASEPLL